MADAGFFKDFLRRIRAGDEAAAAELVRDYAMHLRIEVRRRLNDPYLNSAFDSDDICQSVLKSFFVRAVAGQYDLQQPEDLVKLLVTMAQRKVAAKVRREKTQARDPRRVVGGTDLIDRLPNGPQPERVVAARDLLDRVRDSLTEEERRLADLRAAGRTWPEIAAELGGEPQAHRHKLDRALNRVVVELGLEEEDEP
jgi:DNA-directed RNA polymerase specialized sigma24 family protein